MEVDAEFERRAIYQKRNERLNAIGERALDSCRPRRHGEVSTGNAVDPSAAFNESAKSIFYDLTLVFVIEEVCCRLS
jgi:hypothetical protein